MKGLPSRLAILSFVTGFATLPLAADEAPDPRKHPRPTLEDVLALQARLDDLKSSDLPDDLKSAEANKLKIAIADAWQQLRDLEAPEEADGPDPNDPSDLYFRGWLLSRAAGILADEKPEEALEKLDRARQLFDRVARDFPDWKPEMVAGRRKQTTESLALLSKQVGAPERK